jgi:hypothetical protein
MMAQLSQVECEIANNSCDKFLFEPAFEAACQAIEKAPSE